MYPFLRITAQTLRWRHRPLVPWGTHVSHHRVMPWDLDWLGELNNGLTLTFYDMGRIPFVVRTGLMRVLHRNGMGVTIAGSALRYRRRITLGQRIEQRTRLAGRDARFIYFDQSLWTDPATCAGQGIFRAAVVREGRMVRIEEDVMPLFEREAVARLPALPDWIVAWSAAEADRPWPPPGG